MQSRCRKLVIRAKLVIQFLIFVIQLLFEVLAIFFCEDVYYALQCGFNFCVGICICDCDHSNQGY